MTFTPHPFGLFQGALGTPDATIVWVDTPLLAYWVADGTNDGGADTNLYFYSNIRIGTASQVGIVSRLDGIETYVDTIDPGNFSMGEYVIKYEEVTLVSGSWTNMILWEYGTSPDEPAGTWVDLERCDLRLIDYTNDAIVQHVIIDVTIATDDGAGAPVAGSEVTKRVTLYADYGNARTVSDTFGGTTGTAIDDTSRSPDTDTEGGGWIVDAGTPELYAGHIVGGASGDHRCVIDAGHSDCIARMQIMPDTLGGSSLPYGIIFRRQDSSNYWELILVDAETSNPKLEINEINAGSPTNRDTVTMTGIGPLDGDDCYLQIECNGNVLDGFFQGTYPCSQAELFNVTETSSSMNTEQHFGVRLTGDGSGGTGARGDYFATKIP